MQIFGSDRDHSFMSKKDSDKKMSADVGTLQVTSTILGEVTVVFMQLSLRLFAAIGALRVALFVHLYHYARRRL